MNIEDGQRDLTEPKTLKVTIPTKLHLKLHQLKILSGQNISATVEDALDTYFSEAEGSDASGELGVGQGAL